MARAPSQHTGSGALARVAAALSPGGSVITDRSTTITTGGQNKAVIVAAAAARLVYVQNPDTETETLYVNYGAAATIPVAQTSGNSISLLPGGSDQRITAQSVNAIAATTGHVVVAKENTTS